MGEVGVIFGLIFVFILGIAIYLIPSIIASKADHPNKAAIIALNVLGGWTFIVWVVSLVWAISKPAEKAQYIYIQENREPVEHQRVSQPSSPPRETRQMQHRQQEKDDDIEIDLL